MALCLTAIMSMMLPGFARHKREKYGVNKIFTLSLPLFFKCSLNAMNGIKIQGDLSETKEIDSNLKSDLILYIDNTKDNDLIQFITKAQQQGCNCLDLSKRNINEFPSQLLEFTSLQVNLFK
jgi:hypothetical protein